MSNTWRSLDWNYGQGRLLPYEEMSWLTIPTLTGGLQVKTGGGVIVGQIMVETTGSAGAAYDLYDGNGTGGQAIGPWTLLASQSFDNTYTLYGLPFFNGLYMNVTSGSVRGSVLIGTLTPYPPPEPSDFPEHGG